MRSRCLWLAAGLSAIVGAEIDAASTRTLHTVKIEGMKFSPPEITVAAGDTIVWVNKDLVMHTATSQPKLFDSAIIRAGKSWTFNADKPGTFEYKCKFHPTMKGVVIVK